MNSLHNKIGLSYLNWRVGHRLSLTSRLGELDRLGSGLITPRDQLYIKQKYQIRAFNNQETTNKTRLNGR
jgi:hypothetical protein